MYKYLSMLLPCISGKIVVSQLGDPRSSSLLAGFYACFHPSRIDGKSARTFKRESISSKVAPLSNNISKFQRICRIYIFILRDRFYVSSLRRNDGFLDSDLDQTTTRSNHLLADKRSPLGIQRLGIKLNEAPSS